MKGKMEKVDTTERVCLKVGEERRTGDWKVARTRRLESLRYVAQTFLSASSGDIPVPRFKSSSPPTSDHTPTERAYLGLCPFPTGGGAR